MSECGQGAVIENRIGKNKKVIGRFSVMGSGSGLEMIAPILAFHTICGLGRRSRSLTSTGKWETTGEVGGGASERQEFKDLIRDRKRVVPCGPGRLERRQCTSGGREKEEIRLHKLVHFGDQDRL